MTIRRLKSLVSAMLGVMITLAGCSSGSESGTGVVRLGVSDAPIQDARELCIEFTQAACKRAGTGNQVIV